MSCTESLQCVAFTSPINRTMRFAALIPLSRKTAPSSSGSGSCCYHRPTEVLASSDEMNSPSSPLLLPVKDPTPEPPAGASPAPPPPPPRPTDARCRPAAGTGYGPYVPVSTAGVGFERSTTAGCVGCPISLVLWIGTARSPPIGRVKSAAIGSDDHRCGKLAKPPVPR